MAQKGRRRRKERRPGRYLGKRESNRRTLVARSRHGLENVEAKGDTAKVGEVIGYLENGKGATTSPKAEATPPAPQTRETPPEEKKAATSESKPEKPAAARTTEPSSKEKPRSQRRVEAELPSPPTEEQTEKRPATARVDRQEEIVPMSR